MLRNDYDAIFERVAAEANEYLLELSKEAAAAISLLPILLDKDAADRTVALNDPRYHSLQLVHLLLARSSDRWLTEPFAAAKAAELAALIADRLPASRYGSGSVEGARAQAWAYVGNSLRVLGDLRAAAVALRVSAGHLVAAEGDPLLEAEILSLAASLRDSEGRPAKALRLIDRARSIYRAAGDRHLEGRALFLNGMLLGNTCRYRKAISLIRKGMLLITLEEEPVQVLGAQHNLLYYLAVSGRPRKALDLLSDKRGLYVDLGNWSLLLRLRWLDGFIARQLGDLKASESLLWLARDGFLERGFELDAALATVDIAEVCGFQGRRASTRRLAGEAIPVLESYGALRQAEAARRLFEAAG